MCGRCIYEYNLKIVWGLEVKGFLKYYGYYLLLEIWKRFG